MVAARFGAVKRDQQAFGRLSVVGWVNRVEDQAEEIIEICRKHLQPIAEIINGVPVCKAFAERFCN